MFCIALPTRGPTNPPTVAPITVINPIGFRYCEKGGPPEKKTDLMIPTIKKVPPTAIIPLIVHRTVDI